MLRSECEECKQQYGHDQDCPNASWWETREFIESGCQDAKVKISMKLLGDMLHGIYGNIT